MRLITAAMCLSVIALPAAADVLPAPKPLILTCAAPFTKDASHESLVKHFGASNVAFETVPGPEGSTFQVTAIFPKDPKKRVEVFWHDEAKRKGLLSADVKSPESEWLAPGGIAMKTPIAEVEALNGKPFKVTGYSWDMWGFVVDWMDGTMAKIAKDAGCTNVTMRFEAENVTTDITGEGPYLSNSKGMRNAKATVVEFGIGHAFE